ncbi:hypothetical protein JNB_05460 [Janibacter sp. HTCC2649]|uniref:hypothetical protein n=1 Tax=Janibacter sp. HTCC2649 TaxID=313589 RepID=UPI000066ECE9|nr:hypothetical protein [Janibacter sp. HTCC2649]EAP99594.1 hypothetical protein JNB_05460 [Janibacter sp. HTCC2649]
MEDVHRLHGLGAVVEVRCTGEAAPDLREALTIAWSRCLDAPHESPVDAPPLEVRLDDVSELPRRMMLTTQQVTKNLIQARAGDLLMFHAGAVSDPETGRSLVYIARGGTGKTTLSRLLGKRLGYLTDESVGIDAAGVIHPYPKPLSVRRAQTPKLKDEVSPDALGLLPAPKISHVSRLVLLDRQPGLASADLTDVPFMDAVMAIVEQSSALPELPRPLQRLAELIDEIGPVTRLRYSEATHPEESLIALVQEAS